MVVLGQFRSAGGKQRQQLPAKDVRPGRRTILVVLQLGIPGSVFSLHPVELNAEAMRHELDTADLWTEVEVLGVPEDAVDAAVESVLSRLRVKSTQEGGTVEVQGKPEGRPIRIRSITGPEARKQAAETLEEEGRGTRWAAGILAR